MGQQQLTIGNPTLIDTTVDEGYLETIQEVESIISRQNSVRHPSSQLPELPLYVPKLDLGHTELIGCAVARFLLYTCQAALSELLQSTPNHPHPYPKIHERMRTRNRIAFTEVAPSGAKFRP